MKLTEKTYWEEHWKTVKLPLETKHEDNFLLDKILEVFDLYLKPSKNKTILEIGGAPGQFLVYMKKKFGYKIYAMEYSEVGCKKIEDNLEYFGMQGTILTRDIFSNLDDLPKFDVVYSLGFIEHFSDLELIIKKHLDLIRPNGILIVGCPNFGGLNKLIMTLTSPKRFKGHYLSSMNLKNWEVVEKNLEISPIFKGYIGGFEPKMFSCEKKNPISLFLYGLLFLTRILVTDRFKIFRNLNSKYFSGYLISVYKKVD